MGWNNRRMQRGAELYDLFRALRRDRAAAKELRLWTQLCRLELAWQEEDQRERPGRPSYAPPSRALDALLDKGSLQRGEIVGHAYLSGRAAAKDVIPPASRLVS